MSLPTVTDWDFDYDEGEIHAGSQIKTSVPTKVLQNLDYTLRRNRMIASHSWNPRTNFLTSWETIFTGSAYGPNILGSGISSNIAGTVKAWASDATTGFSVRVYHATYGTLSLTVAAGASAQNEIWRGWMTGTFTAPGDDTIWTYDVDTQVTSGGTGSVIIGGVGLFY